MSIILVIIFILSFCITAKLLPNHKEKYATTLIISLLILSISTLVLSNVFYPPKSNAVPLKETATAASISTPTRRKALTKEEADALRGTGYHGTRPHSQAEDIELKAAQVKCKECGYHSDNGSNSLCDYCQRKH